MTALISVIPILLLIVLMMGFKVSGYKSAVVTLIVTILLALFAVPAMGIVPEKYAGVSIFGITIWSVVEGFLKACFPIILIIICAIFSYNILCETKEIETIKTQFYPCRHPDRTGLQADVLSRYLSGSQYGGRRLRCCGSARHDAGQPGSCQWCGYA